MTLRRTRSSRVELYAARNGQRVCVEACIVVGQRACVLGVSGADCADGRHAHTDQVALRMSRVALKVAVKPPLSLRDRKRIFRQREMIHPDVHVARRNEFLRCKPKRLQLQFRLGISSATICFCALNRAGRCA